MSPSSRLRFEPAAQIQMTHLFQSAISSFIQHFTYSSKYRNTFLMCALWSYNPTKSCSLPRFNIGFSSSSFGYTSVTQIQTGLRVFSQHPNTFYFYVHFNKDLFFSFDIPCTWGETGIWITQNQVITQLTTISHHAC